METKMFYDAPRSISIGDIFYVIDTRERNDFSSPCRVCNDENNLNVLPDEKFLQIYSQDGYFARNCERFIFDDYKLACRAAEILNESELARLNKYNAEHDTSFAPIWDKTNDPKN